MAKVNTPLILDIENTQQLTEVQDQYTQAWDTGDKIPSSPFSGSEWIDTVLQNHSHNFQLWQHEDQARRDDQGHSHVYHAKRAIDHHNQQRNNKMEAMDTVLYGYFALADQQPATQAHSETPGMMIDRLSILSLKKYYMGKQAVREDASASHRRVCHEKTQVIQLQRHDLAKALDELFVAIKQGNKGFKLYKQMKMYNDPNLNPQIYGKVPSE